MNKLSTIQISRLAGAFLVVAMGVVLPTEGAAAPGRVGIQGVLRTASGGPGADGKYAMTVRIYADAKATKPAWEETALGVVVKGGAFDFVAGNTTPVTSAALAKLTDPHVAVALDGATELSRVPLSAVPFAVHANTAAGLSCSGCLTANHFKGGLSASSVSFTYAGSTTKGGPATKALDLECTGCVSAKELKFDGDLNLGGHGLVAKKVTADSVVAKTVAAGSYIGDGSKLTGIKIPSGMCDSKGEVVRGINADGSLACVKGLDPSKLPADALDEVSNGLLTNQFKDEFSGKANLGIPDNSPNGVTDVIDVPDIGIAQGLTVKVDVKNSDAPKVKVLLFDPANKPPAAVSKNLNKTKHYVLYNGGVAKGKDIQLIMPKPDKPKSGDLGAWVGKNAKGKWHLVVIDGSYLDNKIDGAIVKWSIAIDTLSNQKVAATKTLLINGAVRLPRLAAPPATCDFASLGHMYADTKAKQLRFCDGKSWAVLHAWGLGENAQSAGDSCKALFDKGAKKDGVYWIKPFGKPIRAFCNMTLLGGGWTMVFKYSPSSNFAKPGANILKAHNSSDIAMLDTGKESKLYSMGGINVTGASQLLAVVYQGGKAATWFGFKLQGNDPNATWKKGNIVPALTKVNTSGFDASLISLGAGSCREFYITRNHGGCHNDAGALVINSAGCGPGCAWEKANTIQWWGGPGDYKNYTNGIRKDGEVLALYVR